MHQRHFEFVKRQCKSDQKKRIDPSKFIRQTRSVLDAFEMSNLSPGSTQRNHFSAFNRDAGQDSFQFTSLYNSPARLQGRIHVDQNSRMFLNMSFQEIRTESYHLPSEMLMNKAELKMIKKKRVEQSRSKCTVCHNMYLKNEVIRILPCNHLFHYRCLKPWFKQSNICPLCRMNVKEKLREIREENEDQSPLLKGRRPNRSGRPENNNILDELSANNDFHSDLVPVPGVMTSTEQVVNQSNIYCLGIYQEYCWAY